MGASKPDFYYFKAADIVLNVIPDVLRAEFKIIWDAKYPHLPWDDTKPACIQHLLSEEQNAPIRNKKMIKDIKDVNKNLFPGQLPSSDCNRWDPSLLLQLLLFSNSIGQYLKTQDPPRHAHIDALRKHRNSVAHSNNTNLSKADFDIMYNDIKTRITALNYPLTVQEIEEIEANPARPSPLEIDAIKHLLNLQEENRHLIKVLFAGVVTLASIVTAVVINKETESEENRVLLERYLEKANNNRVLIIGLIFAVLVFAFVVLFPSIRKSKESTIDFFPKSKKPRHFRGRETEIADVIKALNGSSQSSPYRLYNLYGSPAFGKTATSIAVGEQFYDKLRYRVAFVELKGKVTISEIAAKILSALGLENLEEFSEKAFSDQLRRKITTKTLLILDNVEDVLLSVNKDEFKGLIRDNILTVNPISILSTSRIRFDIVSLSMKSVRLYKLPNKNCMEVLQFLNPGIKEEHAKRFAVLTGGIPLLIELIGSQLESGISKAEELIRTIEQSNAIVASEETEDIEKSKNLYILTEILFSRIKLKLQKVFLALSVFPASFSLANAEGVLTKVFGSSYDKTDLRLLEHASFLRDASNIGSRNRFDMHPILKEFAQLVSQRKETKNDLYKSVLNKSEISFHNFFIHVLQMLSELFGSTESQKAMEQYDEESVNMRKMFTEAVRYTELYPSYTNVLFEASDLLLYKVPEYDLSRIFSNAADKARGDGKKDLEVALLALQGDRGDVYFYHNKDKYGLTQDLVDMEMDLIEENYTCDPDTDVNMTALSYFVLGRAHALYPSRKDWDPSGRALNWLIPKEVSRWSKRQLNYMNKAKMSEVKQWPTRFSDCCIRTGKNTISR